MTCHHRVFTASVSTVNELWEQAILPYNLPMTILLGLVVIFWVLTLLGAAGVDSLDADATVEGDLGDIPAAMLRVVNAGMIPVTVVLSILILGMWICSIILNFYFNPGHNGFLSLCFFFAAFVLGVILTKLITQPLVPFMRKLKDAENTAPVIGEVGIVRSIQIDTEYGQIEVLRPGGAPALLNARLGIDATPAARGTQVAIISMDEKTGVYLARALPPLPPLD